jgi:anti-sigma regulatory factor (Ser/Thr protein kinase)
VRTRPPTLARRQSRMRMPSRRDAVAGTVDRILRAVEPAGLSHDQRESFAVALAEALSNAAVHGNRLRPRTSVQVKVEVEPGRRAMVVVTDSGRGFDATCLCDPTEPSHLLATGGRGVYLMRQLVDDVEYNQAGNEVRLTMERHGKDRHR